VEAERIFYFTAKTEPLIGHRPISKTIDAISQRANGSKGDGIDARQGNSRDGSSRSKRPTLSTIATIEFGGGLRSLLDEPGRVDYRRQPSGP